MTSEHQVYGLIACYIVVELVKFFVPYIVKKDSALAPLEQFYLRELHNMHNVKDGDGRPLWYFPTSAMESIAGQNTKITEMLERISNSQNDISSILAHMLGKMKEE